LGAQTTDLIIEQYNLSTPTLLIWFLGSHHDWDNVYCEFFSQNLKR
jgi:hypothetical protein